MYFPGKYTFRYLLLFLRNGVNYSKLHLALIFIFKNLLFAPLIWVNEIALFIKLRHQAQSEFPVVFVLGYWRSGTSYLQEQLSLHLDYDTLKIYDAFFPEHSFLTRRFLLRPLNKLVKKLNLYFDVHRTKLDLNKSAEEEVALLSLGNSNSLILFHMFPNLYPIVQSDHQRLSYIKSYKELVRSVYLNGKQKGIVLKSPTNLLCIKQLVKEFPNAKYVYIQRDKEEVYKSNQYLWSLIEKRTAFQKLSTDRINFIIKDSYSKFISDYKRDKALIEDSLIEMDFKDLCKSPELTINKIKNRLDFE